MHRRRDIAAIATSLSPQDRGRAIDGLASFSRAAGVLPAVNPFGWGDAR